MFDDTLIRQLAAELHQSEKSRVQVEHFSKRYPGMTIEDGYRISRAWMDLKRAEGRNVIGHKIGLTSRAMQQASQITGRICVLSTSSQPRIDSGGTPVRPLGPPVSQCISTNPICTMMPSPSVAIAK